MVTSKVVVALGAFALTLGVVSAADSDARSSKDVVLVEVNGVKLTLADLEQKKTIAVFQANTGYYAAERKAIEEMVDDTLLQQQAAKEGLTVDQLLDKHVKATIQKPPSDEALRLYYEGLDTTQPFEAVRDKIIDALRDRRTARAKTAYMDALRKQSAVVIRLAPPRAPISMAGAPTRGAVNGPVVLLEYADYECPVCQQTKPTVDKIEAEFKGKLTFAFKDFPLAQHPNAEKAAEAARCAGEQGKFWPFHDLVLNEKHPELAALKNYARDLKMDGPAFDKCVDSGAKADIVKKDLDEATNMGLRGTPTFFVNGRYISGTSYEEIKSVIVEELSATSAPTAQGAPEAAKGRQ